MHILIPYCHVSLPYITGFGHSNEPLQNTNKPHARAHHAIIIAILVITAMSTLCNSKISHTTLILFHHAPILTLYNSLISHAF